MKPIITISLGIILAGASLAMAAEGGKAAVVQQALAQAPAAELPAKAADLVKAARSKDRALITVDVVKASLALNPVSATAVVGAIARAVPDLASIAAAAAANEQPALAAEIARAAAAAAPTKAEKIVAAVCRVAPKQYRAIALSLAQAAPESGPAVLRAVATVFPEMKGGIDNALANTQGATPSVTTVLEAARTGPAAAPIAASPRPIPMAVSFQLGGAPAPSPSFDAPSAPGGGSSVVSHPKPPPRGGRNYAAP